MRRPSAAAYLLMLAVLGLTPALPGEVNAHGPADVTDEGIARMEEVVVTARKLPLSAASSKEINTKDYLLRPHSTTQEILNNVPGLLVLQHQGGGKAFQYFIRGFDIDHGTDLLLTADGMPINLVTHSHGQGYADTNFLIPETIEGIRLFKGPYFAEFGDFAVAGAVAFKTLDEFPENFVLAEGGYFDTARVVLGGSHDFDFMKALFAAEIYTSNGYFQEPQNFWRYNFFTKLTFDSDPHHKLSVSAQVYDADWDASGQIPLRTVDSGELSRFGTLDPTEGGTSDRELVNLQYWWTPNDEEQVYAQLWGQRYALHLFSNFTFFRETGLRFVGLPNGGFVDTCASWTPDNPVCDPIDPNANYIPGDGIDQKDQRLLFGGQVVYLRDGEVGDVPYEAQLGIYSRNDFPDVGLHRQVQRKRFFTVNQVSVAESSTGGFLQAELFPTDWFRVQMGVRGDVFFFDVDDRLPLQAADRNFAPVPIQGNEVDGIVSPKLNMIFTPFDVDLDLYLNGGSGFHSNDARGVILTGTDGLVRAVGGEAGARSSEIEGLDLAAAVWILDLDSELVFSGDGGDVDADFDLVTGNFIPGGASRRWGVDFNSRYQINDWAYFDYDLAWADPRFQNGDAIPLAPTLFMNGGLTFEYEGFGAAFRVRYLDNRPANEDDTISAQGWALFDILLRYRWRNVEASLSFLNVTDTSWRETQFAEATCLRGEEGPGQPCPDSGSLPADMFLADGIEGITFTPGAPFSIRGGIQVFF
jgi:hypothetical protein